MCSQRKCCRCGLVRRHPKIVPQYTSTYRGDELPAQAATVSQTFAEAGCRRERSRGRRQQQRGQRQRKQRRTREASTHGNCVPPPKRQRAGERVQDSQRPRCRARRELAHHEIGGRSPLQSSKIARSCCLARDSARGSRACGRHRAHAAPRVVQGMVSLACCTR